MICLWHACWFWCLLFSIQSWLVLYYNVTSTKVAITLYTLVLHSCFPCAKCLTTYTDSEGLQIKWCGHLLKNISMQCTENVQYWKAGSGLGTRLCKESQQETQAKTAKYHWAAHYTASLHFRSSGTKGCWSTQCPVLQTLYCNVGGGLRCIKPRHSNLTKFLWGWFTTT